MKIAIFFIIILCNWNSVIWAWELRKRYINKAREKDRSVVLLTEITPRNFWDLVKNTRTRNIEGNKGRMSFLNFCTWILDFSILGIIYLIAVIYQTWHT